MAYRFFGKFTRLYSKGDKLGYPLLSSNVYTHPWIPGEAPRCMFSVQKSLSRLPVPALHQTLEKYLRYVQSLVPQGDYEYTKKVVEEFGAPEGEGEQLQKLLVQKAKNTENWLSEWWLRVAYLDGRSPIIVHSNPGIRFPLENFQTERDWLLFASRFARSVIDYKSLTEEQRLSVDMLGGQPLCMMQFYTILNSCRIPGLRTDSIECHRPDSSTPGPTHICVAHRNRFYEVEVYDENHNPVDELTLLNRLTAVVRRSQTKGQPLGLMTTEHRNVWAKAYERLARDKTNQASLTSIQRSICLICLDDPVFEEVDPEDKETVACMNCLHGMGHKANSANRWFDKTIQFCFSRDGACGLNWEHSPAEGPPVIRLIEHCYTYMKENPAPQVPGGLSTSEQDEMAVKELAFSLDHDTRDDLDMAKDDIASLVNDLQVKSHRFEHFGKSKIKSQRLGPDGFFQIGLQLAYTRMHGKPCATYESGSLRRFQLGRTDTIRSCSPQSVAFTQAMLDPNCPWEERLERMVAAIAQHRRYTDEVMLGQGIDRHLLGLKLTAIEHGHNVPEIFMDTSYSKSLHYNLSTSQVPSSMENTVTFGPLVPDGYGLCYNPQPNSIIYVVSCYKSSPDTNAVKLAAALETALLDMYSLLDQPDLKKQNGTEPKAKL